ncbi:hypothetical protein CN446_19035 [Bacillus cereus]|nr:hypothetical protein CN446_19035 [Bacillus cereus]PGU50725.1 hypothetical protein COD70_29210 [Bacillus cereus]
MATKYFYKNVKNWRDELAEVEGDSIKKEYILDALQEILTQETCFFDTETGHPEKTLDMDVCKVCGKPRTDITHKRSAWVCEECTEEQD